MPTRLHSRPDRIEKYNKPICVDECCYEGNLPESWGNLSAEEMTARFWMAIASGAYCTHGETFLDDNDIVWWAKGGVTVAILVPTSLASSTASSPVTQNSALT